ncbi:MAG: 5-methyltetrahydrofolate--homocysteine methyltransferase, partial [Clostridiales bacterium]|nr:5-methyltetrahydrofolate--homocysteine methyltransferase [Clostridiales bacterium]
EHMQVLMNAGANLIGGCCGTTPEFVAQLRKRVG